jgi:hypothetical protein
MREKGYIIYDASLDPHYWDKDIDFVLTSPTSGLTRSVEVKWDTKINKTGNLYLELTNVFSKGGRGWFEFCEADYLAYGDAIAQVFYVIPLYELRHKIKTLPQRVVNCGDDSTGLLVSLQDIQDIVAIM